MRPTRILHRAQRRRDEEGAIAIMIAGAMVALCLVAALVLDFGIVRFDKQANKAAADVATAAGLRALDADPAVPANAGRPHPFQGACEALNYLKANRSEFSSGSLASVWRTGAGNVVSDPCAGTTPQWNTVCNPDDKSTWAWYTGTVTKSDGAQMVVTIKSGYQLDDTVPVAFSEEAVLNDPGDENRKGCDQLAVIVQETEKPGLGSLATDEDITTVVRTVGRVEIDDRPGIPVALLLLERKDCSVLSNNSSDASIIVKGYGEKPGLIHSDSLGNGAGCTSRNIFYSQKTDGIRVKQSEVGAAPGVITVRALSGEAGAVPAKAEIDPTQIVIEPNERPTGRELVSRSVIDNVYLHHVSAVRDEANSVVRMTPSQRSSAGFTEVGCTPTTTQMAAVKLWVTCARFTDGNFPNATDVVFNGTVSANDVRLPKAKKVYITGTSSNSYGLRFKNFQMNHSGASACNGITSTPARLVIGGGSLTNLGDGADGAGKLQLCNTAVLLMGAQQDACLGTDYDTTPACANGILNVTNSTIDWSAPDSVGQSTRSQSDFAQLEDLALWAETPSTGYSLSGSLTLSGVFMAPKANPFKISGGGFLSVEDSQFIVRKLEVTGAGEFALRPDPYNAVPIPFMSGFSLVR